MWQRFESRNASGVSAYQQTVGAESPGDVRYVLSPRPWRETGGGERNLFGMPGTLLEGQKFVAADEHFGTFGLEQHFAFAG